MEPFRRIASRFGTSTGTLQRHKAKHIPLALSKAKEAEAVAHGDTLLDQLQDLQAKALGILAAAERDGDRRSCLGAICEARSILELVGKVTGELKTHHEVSGTVRVLHGATMEQILALIPGGETAALWEIVDGESTVLE